MGRKYLWNTWWKTYNKFIKQIKTYKGSDCEIAMYFMEHGKKIDCVNAGYTDEEPYRVIEEDK